MSANTGIQRDLYLEFVSVLTKMHAILGAHLASRSDLTIRSFVILHFIEKGKMPQGRLLEDAGISRTEFDDLKIELLEGDLISRSREEGSDEDHFDLTEKGMKTMSQLSNEIGVLLGNTMTRVEMDYFSTAFGVANVRLRDIIDRST